MKINNKRNEAVAFGSIRCGDVFIQHSPHSEGVCMKIESTYGNDNGDYENAVNLVDGSLIFFEDGEMVQPVKCELVIE